MHQVTGEALTVVTKTGESPLDLHVQPLDFILDILGYFTLASIANLNFNLQ